MTDHDSMLGPTSPARLTMQSFPWKLAYRLVYVGLGCAFVALSLFKNSTLKRKSARRKLWRNGSHGDGDSHKIVNGTAVPAQAYPWYVQAQNAQCGGSLIGSNLILTAAHCRSQFAPNREVYIGNHIKNSFEGGAERHIIEKIAVHPEFHDSPVNTFDFLLVKTVVPSRKTPIRLNEDPMIPIAGDNLTIAGFGVEVLGGPPSMVLRETELDYVTSFECGMSYGRKNLISASMMCAARPYRDSCSGDSGGPLFKDGTLFGLVSWGAGCADERYPGAYARVSTAVPWIKEQGCLMGDAPFCERRIMSNITLKELELEIQYDERPLETSWKFEDKDENIYAFQPQGAIREANFTLNERVNVSITNSMRLVLYDSKGDGFCCTHGKGRYRISVDNKLLASGKSEFTSTKTIDITLTDLFVPITTMISMETTPTTTSTSLMTTTTAPETTSTTTPVVTSSAEATPTTTSTSIMTTTTAPETMSTTTPVVTSSAAPQTSATIDPTHNTVHFEKLTDDEDITSLLEKWMTKLESANDLQERISVKVDEAFDANNVQ